MLGMDPEQAVVRVKTVVVAMVVVLVVRVDVVVEVEVAVVIVSSRIIVVSVEESSSKPRLELTCSGLCKVVCPSVLSRLLLGLSVVDVCGPGGGCLSGGFRALMAAAARGDPWRAATAENRQVFSPSTRGTSLEETRVSAGEGETTLEPGSINAEVAPRCYPQVEPPGVRKVDWVEAGGG